MAEQYSKEYLDEVHKNMDEKLEKILTQVTYTNGKVKKIIIALVAMFMFALGLGLKEAQTLVSLIT